MLQKSAKISIMIVDDEESIREFLQIMLKREGYTVDTVANPIEALKLMEKKSYEIVISDLTMPQMTGIELLGKIKTQNPDTAVIMITAFGSTETAVEAMKLGASDYILKPFQIDAIKLAIKKILKTIALEQENRELRKELDKSFSFEKIIGNSPSMQAVFDLITRISQTKTNILILGESGTGKELVAHAIHRSSPDRDAPFIAINCGAIPENLLESELFGHKKGSYTGAISDTKGLFQQADGGTIFLDEIAELPLGLQVKLLRAIQTKSFRPVGGTEDITANVRFLCATNRDLEAAVQKGTFREDLFYRLNVIQVKLPSLRERREDIPMLAKHFLEKYSATMDKNIKTISREAMAILCKYDFPGNVRELENTIERAVALETHQVILPESLPLKILEAVPAVNIAPIPEIQTSTQALPDAAISGFNLEKQVEEFEKRHILSALEKTGGVKKKAAELLGISFRSFRYRIEKYGIDDPNPQESDT